MMPGLEKPARRISILPCLFFVRLSAGALLSEAPTPVLAAISSPPVRLSLKQTCSEPNQKQKKSRLKSQDFKILLVLDLVHLKA